MAITPQAIKDQEFQVKFRGYDTVEVKAYLELIAEEFFELLEQVRQQVDELDIIVEERDGLLREKKALEVELSSTQGSSLKIETEAGKRDFEVAEMQTRISEMTSEIAALKEEVQLKEESILEAKGEYRQEKAECQTEKDRVGRLLTKIEELEQQNEQLRSEELDFKSTLVAAQKFTNEMKKKSETESRLIINKAKDEAEQLRQETYAELSKYPAEIDRLKARRKEVREDIEAVLKLAMENLEIFKEQEKEDYGELYRKIMAMGNEKAVSSDNLDDIDVSFDFDDAEDASIGDVFTLVDEDSDSGDKN